MTETNYGGITSHYPEDLPSDSEPTTKKFDGFNELTPTGRYMETAVERNYDNPAFEEWAEKQPMRHPNGLSVSDTVIPGDPPEEDEGLSDDPEERARELLENAGLDTNFVYHSIDQHTLVNVLRTELDILQDKDYRDRDKETVITWLNRRIDQIDNEIKLEKRIRG